MAELRRKDYVDNPKVRLAKPTREKYCSRLDNHILPRWKATRLGKFRPKEILDWLQSECSSWHMMTDLRNIMSGIFARAQEWEILDETFANPMARVKVGRKWTVRPDRILTQEETAEVFARLVDPQLLICGIRASGRRSRSRPWTPDTISRASGCTLSGGQTSPGGRRLAEAPLKPARSPATRS